MMYFNYIFWFMTISAIPFVPLFYVKFGLKSISNKLFAILCAVALTVIVLLTIAINIDMDYIASGKQPIKYNYEQSHNKVHYQPIYYYRNNYAWTRTK